MPKRTGADYAYSLEIPVDGSQVEESAEDQELRVVAQTQDGSLVSATLSLDKGRQGSVSLGFREQPGRVRVFIGPARATDEELANSQTISVDVPGHTWGDQRQLKLEPILVAPYFWFWWLWWCREYVVRGRVVCPDGRPVPGAEVCAYDVDWWFFWSSTQLVGCQTTDINGAFEIRFRWCCGFWPWWWWRYREWQLNPHLVERVLPVLERDPRVKLSRASAQPSLSVFAELLAQEGVPTNRPLEAADAGRLESIRNVLLAKLPPAPELEKLRVWPWCPWWPWWDCAPDIIFRVTQDCRRPGAVIVDEGIGQTRWNIGSPLDVTLVANEELACCRPVCPPPCHEGHCIDISEVCFASLDEIGGNAGTGGPDGYLFPGAVTASPPGPATYNGDRPFAGTIPVYKANTMTGVDYYEIEVWDGSTWQALPAGAAVNFCRHWLQPPHPPGQPLWQHGDVDFKFTLKSGHNVVESREHWEATTGLPFGAFWAINEQLVVALDSTKFPDGTYRFHVVGWQDGGGGTIINPTVLQFCESDVAAEWMLTFDNRLEPDPSHPTSPSHLCGGGNVHHCVTEPDTNFINVRINGVDVSECGTVELGGGILEVDFLAHDPDDHLAVYTLEAHYGQGHVVDLLRQPSSSLSVIAADYTGPTYAEALGQGAPAPSWHGGTIHLEVAVADAFPVPCCYELRLQAWKRTVVGYGPASDCGFGCERNFAHWNISEYTVGVGECPPRDDLRERIAEGALDVVR